MKKFFIILSVMLMTAVAAEAKIKFGVRAGANITEMSFSTDVLDAKNRTGFYLGPTVKIGLPLGFDVDASVIYNQWEADTEIYSDNNTKAPNLKRKALSLPLNLRKGFGLGDKASVFVFAGPQFSYNIGDKKIKEIDWEWKTTDISINVGVGAMLLNFLEVKANYNIPCGKTGEFKVGEAVDGVYDTLRGKTGGWQIGAAVYF